MGRLNLAGVAGDRWGWVPIRRDKATLGGPIGGQVAGVRALNPYALLWRAPDLWPLGTVWERLKGPNWARMSHNGKPSAAMRSQTVEIYTASRLNLGVSPQGPRKVFFW